MFDLIENPNVEDYQIIVSNKRKYNHKFLFCMNKVYKITYDNIKKNELQIKRCNPTKKNINIYDYNINNIIPFINIQIVNSISFEIHEGDLLSNIYLYLKDLFVFDKMEINLNNIKIIISFNAFDQYYLINDETKIIFSSINNYKLYNNIHEINNTSLAYITFSISHINGSFKRNLLDDINLLNYQDFCKELDRNLKCLYIDKKFNIISNNCEFEVKVTFINLKLKDEQKKLVSKTIYNFTDTKIDKMHVICNKNVYINKNIKRTHYLSIIIENGPTNNMIYDIYKVMHEINNKLKFNYIKVNDIFKINIGNDILTIKINNVNHDITSYEAYYIENDIEISLLNNSIKKLFAYKPELIHTITSLDVHILKYTKTPTMESLLGGCKKTNSVPEIDINFIQNIIRNTPYYLYDNHDTFQDDFILKYDNIVVKDKKDLDKCLLKFDYTTKINIIKSDNCNIKLIDSNLSNGSNINMSIEEIKNIKTKLVDNGLAGMDAQVDKIIKEILLPRSSFINDTFRKIIKLPKGIILYGPPGTGKTSLARNIAKIIGITNNRIKMLNATEVFSKYLGESEENIRKLFKDAREDIKNLHLVIIDEVDSIFKSRSNSSTDNCKSDIVNQFLGEMDGLESINNIIIIGITNKIDMLDSAILRPGRFGCKIYCGLPNEEERLNIIKLYHDRIVDAVKFDEIYFDKLVKITNGFSGAQIEDIYVKIVELVIESQFNGNDIIITNEIINNIVDTIE
jgi:ATP-dependent 26S proteasome regulatory subunit